MLVDKFNE